MTVEIQEIFTKSPKALFAGCVDVNSVRKRRNSLLRKIHPDVCKDPQANDAVFLLNKKFDIALVCVDTGLWPPDGVKTHEFKKRDGYIFKVHAIITRQSHLPSKIDMVTPGFAVYQINDDSSVVGFVNNFKNHVLKKYPTGKYLSDYIPKATDTKLDGDMLFIAQRPKDSVSLADVLATEGYVSPKTAAWIISGLLDFCCLMQTNDTVHCGLLLENIFIVPENHSIVITGGWQYAHKVDKKITTVPSFVYSSSVKWLKDKKAITPIMLESVKAIGRRLIKDPPKPMKSWLFTGAKTSAVEEYSAWEKARNASFGERKFHKAEFSAETIHNKLKEKNDG